MKLIKWAALIALTLIHLTLFGQSCNEIRYPIKRSKIEICGDGTTDFRNAIVRIQCGDNQGTGFFVNVQEGYVITAHHVIEAFGESNRIIGYSPAAPDDSIFFDVVTSLQGEGQMVDAALLRVSNKNWEALRSEITSADVSFKIPEHGDVKYYKLGFPKETYSLEPQEAGYVKTTEKGLYQMDQIVLPGDSGSPLIDEFGNVIGLCVVRRDLSSPYYLPTIRFKKLLDRLPCGTLMDELDKKIIEGSITKDEFIRKLTLTTRDKIKNTELISWINKTNDDKNRSIYSHKLSEYRYCPLLKAIFSRFIDDESLLADLAKGDAARVSYQMAELEYQNKNYNAARALASRSKLFLEASIKEYTDTNPKTLSSAIGNIISIGDHQIPEKTETEILVGAEKWFALPLEKAGSIKAKPVSDRYLSGLFRDHALSTLLLSKLESLNEARMKYIDESLSSVSISIHLSTFEKLSSSNYALLGNIYYESKLYQKAMRAYSKAWSLDTTTSWVKSNWEYLNNNFIKASRTIEAGTQISTKEVAKNVILENIK